MTFTITTEQFNQLKKIVLSRRYYLSRAQAKLRGQQWQLTLEEFTEIWSANGDQWLHIGKRADSLTLSRIDLDHDWTPNNVEVTTRRIMLAREGRQRTKNRSTNK